MPAPNQHQARCAATDPIVPCLRLPEPRRALLLAVCSFVRAARICPGVLRIALIGSLVTNKPIPKDADVLVTIDDTTDLTGLARAASAPQGVCSNHQPSSLMRLGVTSDAFASIASAIRAWHASPSIADAAPTSTMTHVVTLSKELLAAPPIDLWPDVVRRLKVPPDVEALLLTELERVR